MALYHTTVVDNQIKALPTVSTASGSVATFDTDMQENLVEVECEIVYQQQSGTPSPSNPLPIGAYDSLTLYHNDINMWNELWELGDIDVATGQPYASNLKIRSKTFCPISDNANYYFYCSNSEVFTQVLFYDEGFNYLGRVTSGVYASGYHNPFNPNDYVSGARYFKLAIGQSYGTTYNNDISINYPSTDTQYHAFNGAYIPFGQTVAQGVLNVGTGVLTVTQGYIEFDGSNDENWTFTDTRFVCLISDMLSQASRTYVISNRGVFDASSTADGTIFGFNGSIYYYLSTATTLADFKTWLANNHLQVVYPLATPQIIQLSATQITALLNENNIWCDTGDTSVKYILSVGKAIS